MKKEVHFTTWSIEEQKEVVATFEFEAFDPATTKFPDNLLEVDKMFKHFERRLPVNNFPIEGEDYYVLRGYEGGSYVLSKEEFRGIIQARIDRYKGQYNVAEYEEILSIIDGTHPGKWWEDHFRFSAHRPGYLLIETRREGRRYSIFCD